MPAAVKRHHVFLAVLDPLDGTAEMNGQVGDDDLLGKQASFFAKPAAHVGGEHANPAFGPAQQMD